MKPRKEIDIVEPISFKYFWTDWPSPAHEVWDQNMLKYTTKLSELTAEIQQYVTGAVPVMLAKYFVAVSLPNGAVVPSFLRRTRRGNVSGYVPFGRSHKAKCLKKLMETVTITCPEKQLVTDLGLTCETGYGATYYETTCMVKDDRIWVRLPVGGNMMTKSTPVVPSYFIESNELDCAFWLKHGRGVPQQLELFS